MSNTYIKIKMPISGNKKTPENVGKKLDKLETTEILPIANPDFEKKIDDIIFWLIEFEADSYFPNREIGLDNKGKPIIIMPWGKNYGYWTDNNLVIKDFRTQFETVDITKAEFDKYWNLFEAGK